MIISDRSAEVRELLDAQRASRRSVGMVGTNGGNHTGHLSLVRRAQAENDFVTVFWGGALKVDWASKVTLAYDRNLEEDAALFKAAGVDLLFVPKREDMFATPSVTIIEMPEMYARLDGMPERVGMELVVTMFATFMILAGPSKVYSGEKDWPQLTLFRRMAEDLHLPVSVVGCAVEREPDGLAISSRNSRLTLAERQAAPIVYEALKAGAAAVRDGERSVPRVIEQVTKMISASAEPEYVKLVDAHTLEPREALRGEMRLLASARFGSTSLVDNVGVTVDG
jgi:pantoate--beta-alanine ligase